jgi:hypothetical protein
MLNIKINLTLEKQQNLKQNIANSNQQSSLDSTTSKLINTLEYNLDKIGGFNNLINHISLLNDLYIDLTNLTYQSPKRADRRPIINDFAYYICLLLCTKKNALATLASDLQKLNCQYLADKTNSQFNSYLHRYNISQLKIKTNIDKKFLTKLRNSTYLENCHFPQNHKHITSKIVSVLMEKLFKDKEIYLIDTITRLFY